MAFRNFLLIALAFSVPAAQAAQSVEMVSYSQMVNAAIVKMTDDKGAMSFAYCTLPLDDKDATIAEATRYVEKNNQRACYKRSSEFKTLSKQDSDRFAEMLKENFSEYVSRDLQIEYKEGLRMTEMVLPSMLIPLVGPVLLAPVMQKALNGKPIKWTPKLKKFYIAAVAVAALTTAFYVGTEFYIFHTKSIREASIETVVTKAKAADYEGVDLTLISENSPLILNSFYRALEKTVSDFNQATAKK